MPARRPGTLALGLAAAVLLVCAAGAQEARPTPDTIAPIEAGPTCRAAPAEQVVLSLPSIVEYARRIAATRPGDPDPDVVVLNNAGYSSAEPIAPLPARPAPR